MLTDERYKYLMDLVGMPDSISLLQALQQCALEAVLAERVRVYQAWLEAKNHKPEGE